MGETTARPAIGLAVHPPGGLFDVFELSLFAFVGNGERGALDARVGHYHDSRLIARYAAMAGPHRLSECLPGGHLMMRARRPVFDR